MLRQALAKANQAGRAMEYARFLDSNYPLFSQFGRNIYASDVVQTCIDIIGTELSKLRPRHIRRDADGFMIGAKGSSLNRLFKFRPNQLMTTKDFIEKVTWLLYLNYNCFIYPVYEVVRDSRGNSMKVYKEIYPLDPTQVEFKQDAAGTLHVKMWFRSGDDYTLPYGDIIHLRKKFSVNDVMGGGLNGQPDNAALLTVLEINDEVLKGLPKAVKTSLSVRGVIKINAMLDDDEQDARRKEFEKKIAAGETGIVPMDVKGDFVPLNIDPKVIDKDTLQFLSDKVLSWYGVSLPIFLRKYTDSEYQAFYNQTLEPIIIGLGQSFSSALFTRREQDMGNEIVFYHEALELLDLKSKAEIVKNLGDRGALTNNQMLALFGMEPYEDGNRRFVSLNYIDVDIANAYQMARARRGSQPDDTAGDGGDQE